MKKYNFVYKTINLINGKFYYGVHSTDKLEDGYLGSGWALKQAISKYGRDKFKRKIIQYFDTSKEAYKHEEQLVNKEMINKKSCYNMKAGGIGGSEGGKPLSRKHKEKLSKAFSGKNNPMYGKNALKGKTEEEKKLIRERVYSSTRGISKTKEHIEKVTNGKKRSYVLIDPEGIGYTCCGLKDFCKKYFENWNSASTNLTRVASGNLKHYKKWVCMKVGFDSDKKPKSLSESEVIEIKQLLEKNVMPQHELAKKFDVSISLITSIKMGRTWK